jgi:hypothetical protein
LLATANCWQSSAFAVKTIRLLTVTFLLSVVSREFRASGRDCRLGTGV